MKIKLLLSFMQMGLLCLVSNVQAAHIEGAADSTELKALLNPITTLHGNFHQVIQNEAGKALQTCAGKLWIKKPGQFRWEVLGQEPRVIVADGKKVWDYDKELEQVTIQTLNKGHAAAPIFFLTGNVNALNTEFNIKKMTLIRGRCLKDSDNCFELRPKNSDGAFQRIKIGFKMNILNEMELLDQLGQISLFHFKEMRLNANIPESQFRFTPPKGIDVLTND